MKILKKDFDDLPGIGKEEWERGQICISITQEQVNNVKELANVDILNMAENVLTNEVYQELSKTISRTARNKRINEIEWGQNSIEWLSKILLEGEPNFIITNTTVGACLQDTDHFISTPITTFSTLKESLYNLGTFDGINVYVDPRMLFSEDELAIIKNDFLEYYIDEETAKIVVAGLDATKIILNYRYKIHNSDSTVYKINNIQI